MDASDWAAIGAASVLGFVIIHIAIFAFWIAVRNEIRAARAEISTGIRAAGVRVSYEELERAWKQGVMSAIHAQADVRECRGMRPDAADDDN